MKKIRYEEVMYDIEKNRNHSWIKEIYDRHKNELDRAILDYYGAEITYRKFFEESIALAKAMRKNGINPSDEFVACIDRIPESVYLLGAANIIGANINFISEKFDESYIKKIIANANNKTLFIQTNKTKKLSNILKSLDDYNIVNISHRRSLREGNKFEDIMNKYYDTSESIIPGSTNYDSYIGLGEEYKGDVSAHANLDTPFTTTYSSGTTKKGFPKGIVHVNRHYIVMGRYHDPEVSGLPSLKKYISYSNIPSYSNSYLLSALSDNLILGGKVILDPIDNPNYFILGIKLHNSNVNIATTSTWLLNATNYYMNRIIEVKKLPSALFNFVAGEQLSAGEEKYINKFFKDTKCGTDITHTTFSLAKACTAGADCEHGSIFIKLFRAIFNEMPYRIGRKEPVGMKPFDFVDIQVLRKDGTYCEPLEHGKLVVNSPLNMKEYSHAPEETEDFYCIDAYKKTWGDLKTWGFIDEKRNVSMKGRYIDDESIPCYRIADEILKDTKKIMSCEVVKVKENGINCYVAHIVPQYGTSFNEEKVLAGALNRCILAFGEEIQDVLYFRIRSFKELFPITASIKRDITSLEKEGLANVLIKTKKEVKILKRHK